MHIYLLNMQVLFDYFQYIFGVGLSHPVLLSESE